MGWEELEAEVQELFAPLDGRERFDEAYEVWWSARETDRREARRLGAERVVHQRRLPLAERMGELQAKAERTFARAAAISVETEKPKRQRVPRQKLTDEEKRQRRADYYQRPEVKVRVRQWLKERRRREKAEIRAIRAARDPIVIPPVGPVGRPAWLQALLERSQKGSATSRDDPSSTLS